ncbi:hypothetical protein [Clostridium mediterraneense]|uniref:hypothetical protein n=1 Tax=Clostridium mediterraneense TaxID=1805472 RepID=UPI000B25FBFF|nr:hypothetical protein [Clostridium mediterraneense]
MELSRNTKIETIIDKIIGIENVKSKYCDSGYQCISECFENGKLKYLNLDGTPVKIEVPADKFDSAIEAMEIRIKNGEVPGVTDPNEAKNIISKGSFTYEQAKNISKFGTIESIKYDAVTGIIIASAAIGISTAISLAVLIRDGKDFNSALKHSLYTGVKVAGPTFVTALLSNQLSRVGFKSIEFSTSDIIASIMGPKASAMFVNAFRNGTNIYGVAAVKSAAKMIRGNVITGAVSIGVLSSVDIINIFRGRISTSQLFKNVANTTSTIVGGTAGWIGGVTAGAALGSIVPIVGTAISGVVGGVVGSFVGGAVAGEVSGKILNEFIEDDANKMIKIIEDELIELANDYILNETELIRIVNRFKNDLKLKVLKDMFSSSDRKKFARDLLNPYIEYEVKNRETIIIPTRNKISKELRNVLDKLSDELLETLVNNV